jgi:hypothetical protein
MNALMHFVKSSGFFQSICLQSVHRAVPFVGFVCMQRKIDIAIAKRDPALQRKVG